MITHLYQYAGVGKPVAAFDVHGIFHSPRLKVVTMGEAEEEYLFALQLVHGVELKLVPFQLFHDYGWANQRENPLDLYMNDVVCSCPYLHELICSPHGDLKWKRELERKQSTKPLYDIHYNTNPSKGFFI